MTSRRRRRRRASPGEVLGRGTKTSFLEHVLRWLAVAAGIDEHVPGLLMVAPLLAEREHAGSLWATGRIRWIHAVQSKPRPTGVRLPNIFRPVKAVFPPSTRSALVVESRPGMSLHDSAWPAANTSPASVFQQPTQRAIGRRATDRRRADS